jgi:predicted DNA-binding transcriptional regulator YafY
MYWQESTYAPHEMRASRLVSLLLLLQNRGQLTAAQVARELEVSERTVYRDVEALSAAGIPIYAERGPRGGVRLVEGYRTRLTGMTEDEARALFLSGLPGPAAELGLGTVMTAARLKVLAALPTELRARATRLVERFYLDAAAWFRPDEEVPHLPLLAEAVWESRTVSITYDRGDELTERLLEPLGLVLKAGIWYLVARREGEVRTYRASRIESLTLRDERFERPPGFNLASYWLESSAAWERDVPRLEVDVRVDPAFLDALDEQIGGEAYRAAEILEGNDPEGWVHLRLRLTYPHDAPGRLLGLGSHLEVLGPPETRQRVVALARGVLARHESR